MEAYTRENLEELGVVLEARIKELGIHTPSTMSDSARALSFALGARPVLKHFGHEVLVVYLGRSNALLRTLFLDEQDLPRCALYNGVSSVVARWRMSRIREPVILSSTSPVG